MIRRHGSAAAVLAATIILAFSCKQEEAVVFDFTRTPVQVVHDMNVVQTDKGKASMRMTAATMQRFSFVKDSVQQSYELYLEGFLVKAYNEEGELETTISSDQARHVTTTGEESWCAYGNVVVTNHIKGQKIISDTIWWNREEKQIYTDCYVRLTSEASGMMQGYGMTSDERARHSRILRPFDSYSIARDSTYEYIDTLNLMGPFLRKNL